MGNLGEKLNLDPSRVLAYVTSHVQDGKEPLFSNSIEQSSESGACFMWS